MANSMTPSTSALLPPEFSSRALASLQKISLKLSSFEVVYTPHNRWPHRPGHTGDPRPILRISILDSSFNPPTLSHLAIIKSFPPDNQGNSEHDYDARLLLLSISNADKSLKPGDASHLQRVEMMFILLRDIFFHRPMAGQQSLSPPQDVDGNVAIALIDEPTFVAKAAVLRSFLQTRLPLLHHPELSPPIPGLELTFLLGADTLVRLVCPKYYTSEETMMERLRNFLSPSGQNCRIVCVRRPSAFTNCASQRRLARTLEIAQEFIAPGRIHMIDISADEEAYSSTLTRAQVAERSNYKRFVTDNIGDYLAEHGLYASESDKDEFIDGS